MLLVAAVGAFSVGFFPNAARAELACESAYIGVCLPVSTGENDVNCDDEVVTKSNFPLVNKLDDPYKLDDTGVGDGIACENNEKPAYTPPVTPPTKSPTPKPTKTAATKKPAPKPTKTTKAPVESGTSTKPTLPRTGDNTPFIVGVGVVIVVAGGLTLFMGRTRKVRVEAPKKDL